jgi:hypothetical protein
MSGEERMRHTWLRRVLAGEWPLGQSVLIYLPLWTQTRLEHVKKTFPRTFIGSSEIEKKATDLLSGSDELI